MGLRKFVAPEIVFGVGAASLAGRYMAGLGARRVLVVSDAGVITAGWTQRVLDSLAEAGVATALFDDVTPNPRSRQVMRGAEFYNAEECDSIISVGGGSPTDCAKGIGIVVSNGGHILDYAGVDRVTVPIPPLVCVPTTSGASADVSQFAITTDESAGVKVAVISKAMVPDVSLVDPLTLTTLPRDLTASTILDALAHAVEAFASTGSSPLTDVHALDAARIISENLREALESLDDIEYRSKMMMASLEAGLAFSNASLGVVHAMAHSLGGLLDLPHGHCNAVLLPHAVAANFEAAPDRYRRLVSSLQVRTNGNDDYVREGLVNRLQALGRIAGIETSLSALGVGSETLSALSRAAVADPCIVTNPRFLDEDDVLRIYERAM